MTTTMTANEWPAWLRDMAEDYQELEDDELFESLRKRLDLTLENLTHLAVMVRIAEERGIDVSMLPTRTLLPTLRRIAYGQILPEVAQRFLGHSNVFRKIASLPLADQRRVMDDQPMKVVQVTGGGVTHRKVRPSRMSLQQANQVFASDHVRDQCEQRTYVEQRQERRPRAKAGPYVIDKKRGRVRITEAPLELTRRQLQDILAALD